MIALMTTAKFVVTTDFYVMSLVLPAISREFHLSQVAVAWVAAMQGIFYSGFLVLGGRVADMIGQRRTLMAGIAIFAVGSLLAATSWNVFALLAARILQGLGAAAISPAAFSLITTLLPEGRPRHRALGVFSLTQGLSVVAGLVVAGVLAGLWGWRCVFLITIPVMAAAFFLTLRIVPRRSFETRKSKLDVTGAALFTFATSLLVSALTLVGRYGWTSPVVMGLLGLVVVALLIFGFVERRAPEPLVSPALLRNRAVVGACFAGSGLIAGAAGVLVLTTFYLQTQQKYSALQAAVALLPYALGIVIAGPGVPYLMKRFTDIVVILCSILTTICGIALMATMKWAEPGSFLLLPALVLCALGGITGWAALMNWGTRSVAARQQGLISGMLLMSQQVGVPMGAALLLGIVGRVSGVAVPVGDYQLAYLCAGSFAVLALIVVLITVRSEDFRLGAAVQRLP